MEAILILIIAALLIFIIGMSFGIARNRPIIGGGNDYHGTGDSILSVLLAIAGIIGILFYVLPEELRITNFFNEAEILQSDEPKVPAEEWEVEEGNTPCNSTIFDNVNPENSQENEPFESEAQIPSHSIDSDEQEKSSIVQIGAFMVKAYAEDFLKSLDQSLPTTILDCSDGFYRVGYGLFTYEEAIAFKKKYGLKESIRTFNFSY
ncbi:MAG: SPOR domain-containing protein [Bacteroidota bacterium]